MTDEMSGSNNEIDQAKPMKRYDVSNEEELKDIIKWAKTQPTTFERLQQQKGVKSWFFVSRVMQLLVKTVMDEPYGKQ